MNKRKKPSDFKEFPYESVFMKTEAEVVALNIMKILKRTGDKFRALRWSEYETERKKDSGFSSIEKAYFDRVKPYTTSASKAKMFSKAWRETKTQNV